MTVFRPVEADFSEVSDHWTAEVEAFQRKGPRWTTQLYQDATRKDTERAPEFNHKAALVLRAEGFSQPASARVLGITDRAVRSHLSQPCEALEAERKGIAWRGRVQRHEVTKRGRAPFDVWAYLKATDVPVVADLLGFDPWTAEGLGASTREKVAFYIVDGWTQSEVVALLGISKQAVSKHVAAIKAQVAARKRDTRRLFKPKRTRKL
ncbi:hypothetical protein NKI96_11250 [Mesorhizobium sp. M0292]|uniref:hypothetical protein n=1 Tax=Mesorhizobium sp. M0292 TaxID=2956929 RepID=UPI00333952FD